MKTINLVNGCDYSFITVGNFKTTLISATMTVKLNKETAAANALVFKILKCGTAGCEDVKLFNRRLADLYGAEATIECYKNGDSQILRLVITCLNDRFALEGEKIVDDSAKLLCDMLLSHHLLGKSFGNDTIEREKRLLCEEIAGDMNDKRRYAKKRCEEITCEGEPFSIQPTGTVEDVMKLTPDALFNAYENLLSSAFIKLQVIGCKEPENLLEYFRNGFSQIKRNFVFDNTSVVKEAKKPVTVKEDMPVNQGKLVIGLRCNKGGDDLETAPFFLMADIFGGAPYSRLFTNVREKLSLCYYCSARPIKSKGLIFVESGVEKQNIEKARTAILNELDAIRNGDFTDEVIASSKRTSVDVLKSIYSDQHTLDRWYAIRSTSKTVITPEDFAAAIKEVTKEQIIEAAKETLPDSFYIINPTGGEDNE